MLPKITVNRVLLLLVVLTLLAVALPFINYAPNRLVSGEGASYGRSGRRPSGC